MKKLFVLFVLTILYAARSQAGGTLQIYPLKVSLSPDKTTDSIMLGNQGDTAIDVQVSAKSWDMDEQGKFIETDIGDFVFFPRLLHIQAHEEKAIRIGYNGNFPSIEKSYRLILEELAPVRTPEQQAKDKAGVGINWLMRLSVPMFVMPSPDIPEPDLKINEVKKTAQGWSVAIKNDSNYHAYVRKLTVDLKDGVHQPVASAEAKTAVLRILPGRRVFIDVPVDGKQCSSAKEVTFNFSLEQKAENHPLTYPIQNGACLPSL